MTVASQFYRFLAEKLRTSVFQQKSFYTRPLALFAWRHYPSVSNVFFKFKCTNMVFKYPVARRDENAIDEYHGVKIPDPYRWLEDPDSEETKAFVNAQNDVCMPFIESCPIRKNLEQSITKMWDYPKFGCPFKEGKFYYYFHNSGLQNQSALYQQSSLESLPKVFIDTNLLSKEGLIALSFCEFSKDGEYMGYGLSESGSDWTSIKIRKTSDVEDLPDLIEKVKFSSISWTHDNKGFFYSAYQLTSYAGDGKETGKLKNHSVYYHRLRTNQSEDILCVQFKEHEDWLCGAEVSDCGRYVFISVQETTRNNMIYICDLHLLPNGINDLLPLKCIIDTFESNSSYVTNEGSIFTIKTDKGAPLRKLTNFDFENPSEENWIDLVPEDKKRVLESVVCVDKDKLVTCYLEDVKNTLSMYDLKTGKHLRNFHLDVGTIAIINGKKSQSEVFFKFVSFLSPGIIYHFDLKSQPEVKEFRRIEVPGFDPSLFKTDQVFYPSKDGTKIPMFLVYPKDLVRDGSAPVFLYGYGGFDISLLPQFSVSRIIFVQKFRGVLAVANLRGGGEYGKSWHDSGRLFNKQNVFDDFHAAAEYLVKNKYAHPNKIAVNGGSNGGLLVAAVINQRPELYSCGVADVGVMDMLKYHTFTIGSAWRYDFGSSDVEEEFHYLLKYSPLHNVRVPAEDGVQYPSLLLTTADHDDRVVPLHSLKLIAELQHKLANCSKQTNPLMIRVEVDAGHGASKPTSKVIQEQTDKYSFICKTLDLKYYE